MNISKLSQEVKENSFRKWRRVRVKKKSVMLIRNLLSIIETFYMGQNHKKLTAEKSNINRKLTIRQRSIKKLSPIIHEKRRSWHDKESIFEGLCNIFPGFTLHSNHLTVEEKILIRNVSHRCREKVLKKGRRECSGGIKDGNAASAFTQKINSVKLR